MPKPRILLVEDEHILADLWKRQLTGKAEVVWADTLSKAEKFFDVNNDFDLIVVNCCVPGNKPNSMYLVKKMKDLGYSKPIIARSGAPAFCQKLRDVGASHEAYGEDLIPLVLSLLHLN